MTRLTTAITLVTPRTKQLEEMSNVLTLSQFSPSPTTFTATAQKRKANTKNDKGLKWFKGSPKKSNQKFRLLKSAQQEPAQLVVPTIAARVVEFDIDGTVERVGVTEHLPILDKGDNYSELLVDPNIKLQDEVPKLSSPAFVGRKSKVKSDKVKVKSNKNGKVQPVANSTIEFSQHCLPLPEPSFILLENVKELSAFNRPNSYIRYMEATQEELSDEVEYDLEEEDVQWLELANAKRRKKGGAVVKRRVMEFLMDRLEKESYFQMQSTGMDHGPPIDDDAVCCICMDGECQNSNAILFCDMCNLAVHQDCYGVPYIPEGQWLCRKCLHSPSRAVECVLCPNKGGALKGTDDGRWAHVACAIWIPEVCFANTVFLEPIESIGNIPAARWRLTCFICKQKGIGACIQCYKSSCYTAFHVTCAQQANLVMKMETVREMHMTSVIIKKTAYCNNHAPPEMLLERKLKDGKDVSSPRMKMKQTRKILAEKRDAIPAVLIPTIPRSRIAAISNSVNFPGRPAFMKRLMAYWKLKRQQRNGVPLLRRLQMASSAPNAKPSESKPKNRVEQQEQMDHYKSWVRLRQDLERARLLCEMIRKREKQKRELIYAKVKLAEMEIYPMRTFFLNIINEIISRDSREIFFHPVDVEEVTDYLTRIKEPMDLSTMTAKVNRMEYQSVPDLESDFNLMINNCLLYNDKDTIYYKTALRIRAFGTTIFRKAKKVFDTVGYDSTTGLHLTTRPAVSSISSVDPISCKCNNTSNCNNNCKRNNIPATTPVPSIIPASFTTYRSGGGDGVGSDSEGENDPSTRTRGRGDDDGMGESESDSSSYSSYSSTGGGSESESGDGGRVKKVKIPPKEFPKSSESSESESVDDSDDDGESDVEVRPIGRITTRNNTTNNQDGVRTGTRRGRPLNNKNSPKRTSRSSHLQQQQELNLRNGNESDSDSDSSSSSSSSSSSENIPVFRNKKLV